MFVYDSILRKLPPPPLPLLPEWRLRFDGDFVSEEKEEGAKEEEEEEEEA